MDDRQRRYRERHKKEIAARQQAWERENSKRFAVKFYPTDVSLYDYAMQQDANVTQYVKRLIREDMERNGVEYEPKPKRNRWDGHEKKED